MHRQRCAQQDAFTRASLSVFAVMTEQWENQAVINNPGSAVISTVFWTPTDLSHIFCQTCVNIYCCDSVLLSAVIVNLPSLCLLTDKSDPWPGGAWGRAGRRLVYVVCVARACVFLSATSIATRPDIFPIQSLMPGPVISLYPLHTLETKKKPKTLQQVPCTYTHDHHNHVTSNCGWGWRRHKKLRRMI